MIYYCDGYCLGSNPSKYGGGFTIFNYKDKLIKTKRILKDGFTNNEAELIAVNETAKFAKKNDIIITDSQIVMNWIFKNYSNNRIDLNKMIIETNNLIKEKNLNLCWQQRYFNLAGRYNEDKGFDKSNYNFEDF